MHTNPQNPQQIQVQRRLGRYELRQQIGRGDVGDVWKSYDFQSKHDVALKLIHSDLLQADPDFLQRFMTEGPVLTTLRHENIVSIHEVAVTRLQETNTVAYIASDFIEGQTLTTYLDKTSRSSLFPPLADIVYLFTSLGVAIDYVHQQGIVHGNIKPNNILLDTRKTQHLPCGEPMLTDIGLSRLLGEEVGICSPFYMSPEQAKGESPGHRCDVYSLGVILYELCTGRLPFRDSRSVAILMQHINALPTPPLLLNPQLPPALSEVILRALAKDPVTRYSTASSLAVAIADACSLRSTIPISREALAEEETAYFSQTGPYTSILGVSEPSIPTFSKASLIRPSMPLPSISSSVIRAVPESPLADTTHPSQPVPALQTQFVALPAHTSSKHSVPPPPPLASAPTTTQSSSSAAPAVSFTDTPASPPSSISTTSSRFPVSALQQNAPVTWTLPTRVVSSTPTTSSKVAVPSSDQLASVTPLRTPPSRPPLSPLPTIPTFSERKQSHKREMTIYAIVCSLILVVVFGGSLVGSILLRQQAQAVVGHAFFQDDAFGNADMLRIEIQSSNALSSGQVYRAWLQTSNDHTLPLGTLSRNGNSATLLYQGDAQHTNLLSIAQSVIVTQENSSDTAVKPQGNTVYRASFDMHSLPYIRNILYQTPNFPASNGVVVGLFQTLKSMDDKAGSIVDSIQGTHDLGMAKRQAIRILELIDGTNYAITSGDLPKGTPSNVDAKVGIISSPSQSGYIDTLSTQLNKLQTAVGNNATQLQHIQNVRNALDDLRTWIQQARSYDVQLVKGQDFSNPVLTGAALHLRQLVADAYTGRTIPPNAGPLPIAGSAGAYQAYVECEYLATLDIRHV